MSGPTLDDVDHGILAHLLANARTTNAAIARAVDVAESTVAARITKLEDAGVIRGYTALVDPQAIGIHVVAFVQLDKGGHNEAVTLEEKICSIPHVRRLHRVSADHFWRAEVCAGSLDELGRVLDEELGALTGVECVGREVVISTVKDEAIPLPDGLGEET